MGAKYYALLDHQQSGETYAVEEDADYKITAVCGPIHWRAVPMEEHIPGWLRTLTYDPEDAEWANQQGWALCNRVKQ